MGFFRKGVFALLTLLLLVSLFVTVLTMGLRLTIGSPTKVESLLSKSGFYTSFSDVVINQAKSSSLNTGNDADFNSPLVQEAAHKALSPSFLEKQGNAFIKGNYNWLSGKTTKPEFKIDLGPAREAFAKNTGSAVADRLVTLPTCTNAQLAQLNSQKIDPYTTTCLPFTTNPDEAGQQLTTNLQTNSSFLNNAVLTPDSLDPSQKSTSQPYYQKLTNVPEYYQLLLKAPFILGALALLCALGMVFIARTRRRGLRRISIIFIISGVALVLSKLLLDTVFKQLEKKVSVASSDSAQLQKSLIDLGHGLETSITNYNLYFGIGFVVLAVVLLIILRVKRGSDTPKGANNHLLTKAPENSLVPPTKNGIKPERAKPVSTTETTPMNLKSPAPEPKKKRPTRLIQ